MDEDAVRSTSERVRLLEEALAEYALRFGLSDKARAALGMGERQPLLRARARQEPNAYTDGGPDSGPDAHPDAGRLMRPGSRLS